MILRALIALLSLVVLARSSTRVPTGAEFTTGLKEALENFEPVVSH